MAKKTKKVNSKKQRRRKFWRGFRTFLICLIVFCGIAYAARYVMIDSVKLSSSAMSPDYQKGDVVLISRLSNWKGELPGAGDTVYARFAAIDDCLLREVRGVPGDYLEARGDEIVLIHEGTETNLGVCTALVNGTIPDGAFLLLAKTADEADSRSLGLVYKTDILGSPAAVVWPINHIGAR